MVGRIHTYSRPDWSSGALGDFLVTWPAKKPQAGAQKKKEKKSYPDVCILHKIHTPAQTVSASARATHRKINSSAEV